MKNKTIPELLETFGHALEELRRRGICRSENLPTGDLAEYLACQALALSPAPNSTKGFDATDASGNRYQIKGRRITDRNLSTQLSALRDLDQDPFDYVIVILFDTNYRVTAAYRFTLTACRESGRYVSRTNSHTVFANAAMIRRPDTVDLTKQVLAAYHNAEPDAALNCERLAPLL